MACAARATCSRLLFSQNGRLGGLGPRPLLRTCAPPRPVPAGSNVCARSVPVGRRLPPRRHGDRDGAPAAGLLRRCLPPARPPASRLHARVLRAGLHSNNRLFIPCINGAWCAPPPQLSAARPRATLPKGGGPRPKAQNARTARARAHTPKARGFWVVPAGDCARDVMSGVLQPRVRRR